MTESRYAAFGLILVAYRTRKGLKQDELAQRLGTTQQSLSRWELGTSRPRAKELTAIAAVLEEEVETLLVAAGYSGDIKAAATFDRPFPLETLPGSETFERFCTAFLDLRFGRAQRLGGQGHKQDGFDITVARDGGTRFAFQCKHVHRFGPKDVELAINKGNTFTAQRKVLLLSRVASPQAREALGDSGWELWDQDDISREIRKLAKADQISLVDQFFKGNRLALLGEDEAGPWETIEEFFKPYLGGGLFSHSWELVGRESEQHQLLELIVRSKQAVTVLEGAGGLGKSRLLLAALRAIAKSAPTLRIRVLSSASPVMPKNLDALDDDRTLLVVDDAHDRDDLGQLLRYAAGRTNCSLLLATRPYARDMIRLQTARAGLPLASTVALGALSGKASLALAEQALAKEGGNVKLAEDIAAVAGGSPLFIILASQIAAKDGLHPQFLGKTEAFATRVTLEFERIITSKLVPESEVPQLRELLAVIALVQPIIADDKQLLALLESAKGIGAVQAGRLIRALTEGGILFQRARKLRLSPDLLADSIIDRCCYDSSGGSTGYAEALFDALAEAYLPNLLFNLGKLDWRKHEGADHASELHDNIWRKLRWKSEYINPHVKAAVGAAYFHPRQALRFVEQLVDEGHGQDSNVAEILKQVAHRPEFLGDALTKLWELARTEDRDPEMTRGHPLRVLRDLATPAFEKSLAQLEQVVRYHIDLLERPKRWGERYTPFDVLKGVFKLEGQSTSATGYEIVLTRYGLNFADLAHVRGLVIEAILRKLSDQNLRIAYAAGSALAEALVPGRHGGDNADADFQREVMRTLQGVLREQELHPIATVVQVAIARSVHCRATYVEDETSELAKKAFHRFGDGMRTAVIRMLTDSYDLDIEASEAANPYEEHELLREQFVSQILLENSSLDEVEGFLMSCLDEVRQARAAHDAANHTFIARVIRKRVDLAKSILKAREQGRANLLERQADTALATLLVNRDPYGEELVTRLLAVGDSDSLGLLASAYASSNDELRLSQLGRRVLGEVFGSPHRAVLSHVRFLASTVADCDPRFALELLARVDLTLMAQPSDVFMVLNRQKLIPDELLSSDEGTRILNSLSKVERFDSHYVLEYLKRVAQRDAMLIVHLVKQRLLDRRDPENPFARSFVVGRDEGGVLQLLAPKDGKDKHKQEEKGKQAFLDLLEWAVNRMDDYAFRFDYGQMMKMLFAPYGSVALSYLSDWMSYGGDAHVDVVAEVLRNAQWPIYKDDADAVIQLLERAEEISPAAVKRLTSALYGSSVSGMRMGSPGKPYPRDVQMKDFCTEILERLNPLEPAYKFYKDLLGHAEDAIERQLEEGRLMQELRED